MPDLLYRNREHPRWQRGRRALPRLRQLHERLPDLLLPRRRRRRDPLGHEATRTREWASCFSAGVLVGRRARCATRARRGTGSGSRTSSRRGSTSTARRAASAAADASRGARSASTSPRRSTRSACTTARSRWWGRELDRGPPAEPARSRGRAGAGRGDPPGRARDAGLLDVLVHLARRGRRRLRVRGRPVQHALPVRRRRDRRSRSRRTRRTRSASGHTIRYVGRVTNAFKDLEPGDEIGVRGPFGPRGRCTRPRAATCSSWPAALGVCPVRPAIESAMRHRDRYRRLILLRRRADPGPAPVPGRARRVARARWRASASSCT